MAEIGASSYRRFPQEETALEQILIAYGDSLVRFAYSLVHNAAVAEDLAAESIAIYLTKPKFLREESQMRPYLYRIVHNKAMDYLRHYRHLVALEDVENVLGAGDLEQDAILQQRNQTIYRCLQYLPEQYRQVLQLAYFDGFEVKDICRILRKNAKQVYNLLQRAKVALKTLLEKEGISHEDI